MYPISLATQLYLVYVSHLQKILILLYKYFTKLFYNHRNSKKVGFIRCARKHRHFYVYGFLVRTLKHRRRFRVHWIEHRTHLFQSFYDLTQLCEILVLYLSIYTDTQTTQVCSHKKQAAKTDGCLVYENDKGEVNLFLLYSLPLQLPTALAFVRLISADYAFLSHITIHLF